MEKNKRDKAAEHISLVNISLHAIADAHYARLSEATNGVKIPAALAGRLAFLFSLQAGHKNQEQERQLRGMNCYDATAFVVGGVEFGDVGYGFVRSIPLIDKRRYESLAALTDFLRLVAQRPLVINVGKRPYHSFAFLGFDENGQGIVFNKGNPAQPCEIAPLSDVCQRYRDRGQEPLLSIHYIPDVTVRD